MKTRKKVIATLAATALVLTECALPPATGIAAVLPTATKSLTITAGKKKMVKVKGARIKSTKFKSTNTTIAKVSKKGVVTAQKAGKCKIKATVKYYKTKISKKVYKKVLTTSVTVKKIVVKPKKTATPTTIPTVNPTDQLPLGTSTPDTQALTVSTQAELERALKKTELRSLMLKTEAAEKFTIPEGQYKSINITVDAPNADIVNNGVFQSVNIQAIKTDTWTEQASGNIFNIFANAAHIVIAKGAEVPNITLPKTDVKSKITITVEGKADNILVQSSTSLMIDGDSSAIAAIPVILDTIAENTEITAAIPVEITARTGVNISLEKGAEGSKIITDIITSVSLKIANHTTTTIEVFLTNGKKIQDVLSEEDTDVIINPSQTPATTTPTPIPEITPVPVVTETPGEEVAPTPAVTEAPGDNVTITPAVTEVPGEEVTPTPSDTKNADDVNALKAIIKEQRALGATVSEDLDSEEYGWSESGRLLGIRWDDKNLQGNIDFGVFSALTYLACSYNQLTNLDVSRNTSLSVLQCKYNQIMSLEVNSNIQLRFLSCGNNQLTSLNVSQNTKLETLDCPDNGIMSLDVSHNTALEWLNCSYNQLISLDVNKNIALVDLHCLGNQLTTLEISKIQH